MASLSAWYLSSREHDVTGKCWKVSEWTGSIFQPAWLCTTVPSLLGSYMCSSLYYSESLYPHTITTFHTASGGNLMKVYGKLGEPVNEATSWFLSREQLFWCLTNVVPFTTDVFNFPRLRHPYMPSHWLTLRQLENPHRKWISTSIIMATVVV